MAKVLLLGATGGIGSQALLQLLDRGADVTAIVRSAGRLPREARVHPRLTALECEAGVLGMQLPELAKHARGCDAIVSCLGHRPSAQGLFGHPRKLCADSTRWACEAIGLLQPARPLKVVVVSTGLADHPDATSDPPRGVFERLILWLLEMLLPPHAGVCVRARGRGRGHAWACVSAGRVTVRARSSARLRARARWACLCRYHHCLVTLGRTWTDNMATVRYLYAEASKHPHVEFCAVRPEVLVDGGQRQADVPKYAVHATRQNGLFNAGVTTRANVGRFIADLVSEEAVWARWKGSFPQIFDVRKEMK